jgi:protein ImuB
MFAALHLPDLEITAALRVNPELRGFPSAVVSATADADDPKAKLPLLAINHHARQTGIEAGWQLHRALVRCPGLRILQRRLEAEKALLQELVDLAEALTPDLEITSPATLVLDLSRASKSKIAWLDELEIPHVEIWHARAETPDLAHLAALHEESQGGLVDLEYFKCLPFSLLASLPGTSEWLPMLRLWGLKTLGDFMALPRQALVERLGPAAGDAHDIVHGKSCRLLRLHRPPESYGQSLDFEDGIHLSEPLIFATKRLLHTLSSRVASHYLAVGSLQITLHHELGKSLERMIRLPEPLVDANELLLPVQTFLESLRIESPVVGIDLNATAVSPNPSQREWYGRQLPNPSRWAETLTRLEALLGPGRVGVPVSENTHRPEAFRMLPAMSAEGSSNASQTGCSIPLRRFRPQQSVAVAFENRGNLPVPHAILSGSYLGEIVGKRGPFLLSGDWWEAEKLWRRIEWDVELADGQILRLVFSPVDQWHLEGVYG